MKKLIKEAGIVGAGAGMHPQIVAAGLETPADSVGPDALRGVRAEKRSSILAALGVLVCRAVSKVDVVRIDAGGETRSCSLATATAMESLVFCRALIDECISRRVQKHSQEAMRAILGIAAACAELALMVTIRLGRRSEPAVVA